MASSGAFSAKNSAVDPEVLKYSNFVRDRYQSQRKNYNAQIGKEIRAIIASSKTAFEACRKERLFIGMTLKPLESYKFTHEEKRKLYQILNEKEDVRFKYKTKFIISKFGAEEQQNR